MSQPTEPRTETRPAGISRSSSYSPELEALRGWAILLVFFFHADGAIVGLSRIGTTVSPALAFVTAGHTGVTLFFVLSAILLARPFLAEAEGGAHVSRPNFYRRRVLRIMPLYTVAVVVGVVFSFENPAALLDGVRALFFLNSFTGNVRSLMPYSAVWWSLATEVQFYLVLPLLAVCLRSRAGRILGVLTLAVWGVAYAVFSMDVSLLSNVARFRLGLSMFGRAPAFLFGIAAAWLVLHYGDRLRDAARRSAWFRHGGADVLLLTTLFALGLLLQRVTTVGFIPSEISMPAWHVAESALWTLVVLLVLLAPLRLGSLISNRPFEILGTLSYSIYLVHAPIVFFGIGPLVRSGIPVDSELGLRFVAFGLAFALSLGISAITYRLIERPFLVRKARIER